MRKNFTFVLPDEPYKTETSLNKVLECVYNGPKYISFNYTDATGLINYVARTGETEEELQFDALVDNDPETSFAWFSAADHPFEAAYLLHCYTHGNIEDYEETLPDDLGTYSFKWDDGTGAIGQSFWPNELKWDKGSFIAPRRRTHVLSKESVFEVALLNAADIERSLSENDYSDADRAKLEEHVEWLKALPTAYADIDHWKIPFPSDIPPII